MNVYKPAADSYSITKGKDSGKNPATGIGIPELTHLCRRGQKELKNKRRDQFNLSCYLASDAGFDYVLLKKTVTNSGRHEPVRFSKYSVGCGGALLFAGHKLTDYCLDDSFVMLPDNDMPKQYEKIPVYKEPEPAPEPKPILPGSQLGIETDEDYDALIQMVVDALRQKNGRFAKKVRKAVMSCAYHVLFEMVKETDS